MRIGRPAVRGSTSTVPVEFTGMPTQLWYHVEEEFADFLSDWADAPLVALLIPAMERGENIHVDGVVSSRLFNSLPAYQSLLTKVIPSLHEVQIVPGKVDERATGVHGVATGFSGGIDSFCVLADHFFSDTEPKLTHLLFNNVGSHGSGSQAVRIFEKRYARAAGTAVRVGIPIIKVDSNVDAFYAGPLNFQQTHTARNASVALLLQDGLSHYLYASGISRHDQFIGPKHDTAYSDSFALPLLSTESLLTQSVGDHYTRVEKTIRVSSVADSYVALDVCTYAEQEKNCGRCTKCIRTLLTLDVLGILPKYSAVFDLDEHRKIRASLFAHALQSQDAFLRDIVTFARNRDFAFPLRSRLSLLPEPIRVPMRLARHAARVLLAVFK